VRVSEGKKGGGGDDVEGVFVLGGERLRELESRGGVVENRRRTRTAGTDAWRDGENARARR
jgi:hypothetical protein